MFDTLSLHLEEMFQEALITTEWRLLILAIIIILGPYIAERLRLPGMIGLVLGGLLVGPYGFGLLPEGAMDAIGGIGLLLLMFMAGAELDLNLFARYRGTAIYFGLITFMIPFTLSVIAGWIVGLSALGALLMGSVWASHTLVAYPSVRAAGLTGNRAVAVAVGATVITDTLALLILAVVSGTVSGGGSSPIETLIGLVLGVVLLVVYCMWLLPWVARRFYAGIGQERILRFVFIIGALMSAGFLAVLVGIEGIVGAFFAGLGLNRLIPNGGRLMDQVESFSSSLFVPAFLVMVGMLINPAVLLNFTTVGIALIFLVGLAAGKYAAAWLAGRRYGFSKAEVGIMFSLTIAQAAATLASTLIGYDLGLFSEQIVNSVLLVVILTLVITSLGTVRSAGKIAPEKLILRPVGKSVIVPILNTATLDSLMSLAAGITYPDAGIVKPVVVVPEHETEQHIEEAQEWLEQAVKSAQAATAEVEGALRVDTTIHEGVIRHLKEGEDTLIMTEWVRSPHIQELLFGGLIDHIGARTPVAAAAIHLSTNPIQRLVLVPGVDQETTGYRVDLEVALDIVAHLASSKGWPVALVAPSKQLTPDIEMPGDPELITVERTVDAVSAVLKPGDLVVVPAATVRRNIGSSAFEYVDRRNDIGVMVTAGPYRLTLTSAPQVGRESEAIFALGGAASQT